MFKYTYTPTPLLKSVQKINNWWPLQFQSGLKGGKDLFLYFFLFYYEGFTKNITTTLKLLGSPIYPTPSLSLATRHSGGAAHPLCSGPMAAPKGLGLIPAIGLQPLALVFFFYC